MKTLNNATMVITLFLLAVLVEEVKSGCQSSIFCRGQDCDTLKWMYAFNAEDNTCHAGSGNDLDLGSWMNVNCDPGDYNDCSPIPYPGCQLVKRGSHNKCKAKMMRPRGRRGYQPWFPTLGNGVESQSCDMSFKLECGEKYVYYSDSGWTSDDCICRAYKYYEVQPTPDISECPALHEDPTAHALCVEEATNDWVQRENEIALDGHSHPYCSCGNRRNLAMLRGGDSDSDNFRLFSMK